MITRNRRQRLLVQAAKTAKSNRWGPRAAMKQAGVWSTKWGLGGDLTGGSAQALAAEIHPGTVEVPFSLSDMVSVAVFYAAVQIVWAGGW